jgi:CNT family concentrative nucleoside transporter
MTDFQGISGLLVLPAIAWVLSERRRSVRPREILMGLAVQLLLALALLRVPAAADALALLNQGVLALQEATLAGTSFVFGYLGGADPPFAMAEQAESGSTFILAFRALPLILVMSALSALLFHWRILPVVVAGLSRALQRTLRVGGALGLGAGANVFVGMVEAPLLVRPYLARMTRAELFALMTCGMATIAGTMLVLYATLLGPVIPDALGHILTASLISAPAAIMIARIMVPETAGPTAGTLTDLGRASGAMDAITRGTIDGLNLLAQVIAMLVVLVALVALVNQALGILPPIAGEALTLERMLGWLMAPVVWLMGVPWSEAFTAGALMGTKTVLNELIAYVELASLPEPALSERSRIIMTYAICGFANFGSLGIMVGGLGAMVPERRSEIVGLGMRSIVAGTLATCLTGTVAGLVL